jgi:hypothetical protein
MFLQGCMDEIGSELDATSQDGDDPLFSWEESGTLTSEQ